MVNGATVCIYISRAHGRRDLGVCEAEWGIRCRMTGSSRTKPWNPTTTRTSKLIGVLAARSGSEGWPRVFTALRPRWAATSGGLVHRLLVVCVRYRRFRPGRINAYITALLPGALAATFTDEVRNRSAPDQANNHFHFLNYYALGSWGYFLCVFNHVAINRPGAMD